MNKKTYEQLMKKLDDAESHLQVSHPVPGSLEPHKGSPELISESMDINNISKEQLSLTHCMLHMFYHNKSGKGLTPRTIEKLHKEIEEKLDFHEKFDGLDEQ